MRDLETFWDTSIAIELNENRRGSCPFKETRDTYVFRLEGTLILFPTDATHFSLMRDMEFRRIA